MQRNYLKGFFEMLLNSLDCDMFKPFCSHRGLLSRSSGRVLEDLHRFKRGFLQRDGSMRALWPDRQRVELLSQHVSKF